MRSSRSNTARAAGALAMLWALMVPQPGFASATPGTMKLHGPASELQSPPARLTLRSSELAALDSALAAGAPPIRVLRLLERRGLISKQVRQLGFADSSCHALLFMLSTHDREAQALVRWPDAEPAQELVEIRHLAVVWLTDDPDMRFQVSATQVESKSSLRQDCDAFGGLARSLFSSAAGARELPEDMEPTRYTLGGESISLSCPANVDVSIRRFFRIDNSDSLYRTANFDEIVAADQDHVYLLSRAELGFENESLDHFALAIGGVLSSENARVVSPDASLGGFTVQRSAVETMKGHAMAMLVVQPGRYRSWRPRGHLYQPCYYGDLKRRLSVQLGLEIADRPFDRLFFGAGYGMTSAVDLIGGLAWTQTNAPRQPARLTSLSQLSQLHDLFPTRYEAQWFVGFSLRASELARAVGK